MTALGQAERHGQHEIASSVIGIVYGASVHWVQRTSSVLVIFRAGARWDSFC